VTLGRQNQHNHGIVVQHDHETRLTMCATAKYSATKAIPPRRPPMGLSRAPARNCTQPSESPCCPWIVYPRELAAQTAQPSAPAITCITSSGTKFLLVVRPSFCLRSSEATKWAGILTGCWFRASEHAYKGKGRQAKHNKGIDTTF
jgi:hypothetical protein